MAHKNYNVIKPSKRKASPNAKVKTHQAKPPKPTGKMKAGGNMATRKPAGSKSYRPMDSYGKGDEYGGY